MSPPTLRRRRKLFPILPAAIVGGTLLFAAVVGALYLRGPIVIGKPDKSDSGKVAVETWLAENLDSGEWEEVQWWPERRVPASNEIVNNFPARDTTLARIKFRSETPAGGMKLQDLVFEIKQGKAEPVDPALQPLARQLPDWR